MHNFMAAGVCSLVLVVALSVTCGYFVHNGKTAVKIVRVGVKGKIASVLSCHFVNCAGLST